MRAKSRTITTSRRALGRARTLLLAGGLAAGCGNNAQPGDPDAHVDGGSTVDAATTDAGPAADAAVDAAPDIDAAVLVSPWTELPAGTVSLSGGAATTATGRAKPGGTLHLVSRGGINFDATLPGPAPIAVPAAPAGALRPTSLPADINATGAVVIDGFVASSGADAVRTITASGDIYIVGTLTTADLGASRQGLRLSAGGNVYVVAGGSIDAGGSAPGQAGGGVALAGQQIVIAGGLSTAGGGGFGPGAAAGPVSLRASHDIQISGAIDAMVAMAAATPTSAAATAATSACNSAAICR